MPYARRAQAYQAPADGELPPISNGLIALWPFDDNQGTTARNIVDPANHADISVVSGGWTTGPGGTGVAYDFAAAGDKAVTQNDSLLNGLNAFTVTCNLWKKDNAQGRLLSAQASGGGSTDHMFLFRYGNGALTVFLNDTTNPSWNSIGSGLYIYRTAGWRFNAVSHDAVANVIKFYSDEVDWTDNQKSFTGGISQGPYPLAIGGEAVGTGNPLLGSVQDLRIYDRVLSDQEVYDIRDGIG